MSQWKTNIKGRPARLSKMAKSLTSNRLKYLMVLKTSLLVFWVGSSHGLKFKQLMLSLRVGPRKWLSIGWIKVLHLILIGE